MNIELSEILHPRIQAACLPLLEDEHYKHAVQEAMTQVEIALKEHPLVPSHLHGIRLVDHVFGSGEHITLSVPFGEDYQKKALSLFRGAFEYYRNYSSHDGAKITKPISIRVLALASELLDLLGASRRSFENIGGVTGLIKAGILSDEQELVDLLTFLDGQTILEHDPSEYEISLLSRGFSKLQEEAMFDFGFVIYEEEYVYHPDDISDGTLVGWLKMTEQGCALYEKLNK